MADALNQIAISRVEKSRPDANLTLSALVCEQVLQPKLEADPRLKPRTLYEFLLEQYPQQYEGVLRTLQRRVQEWKAAHGRAKEVMFV